MTTKNNSNGTAVTVKENSNSQVLTAVVASTPDNGTRKAVNLSTNLIEPNNYNARKTFDPAGLEELAQSIKVHGIIQPITVRKVGEKYEIICGERRFRASMMLKLAEIPAIVRELSDDEAYDLSITENLQREDVPPMEAAEAYKYKITKKGYDIASLAIQFGKSEKSIYQTLKLCDLIKGIAELVRAGKLTASAGIVISKYDKKIQEDILKDRLGVGGKGDWCHTSASALERSIKNCYTNNLTDYFFDKKDCLKCAHNSQNYDLFAGCGDCGKCVNKKCLDAKNTAYVVAQAEAVALADPKLVFIGEQYSYDNDATKKVKKGGYEFKNVQTHNLKSYPTEPKTPQEADYSKPEDFEKAQQKYNKEREQYEKKAGELDTLKEQGKIRVYAKIGDKGVSFRYKEVQTKDTKTNEQLIADMTAKKVRNNELAKEKTAEDLKELLYKDSLPQSAFTPAEEAMMYFFMLDKLRRDNYKAVGLKSDDYYGMSDEKKQKIVASLTEQQKTVIRRDFLYSHLKNGIQTVSGVEGGMLLSFATQHLPEKTATIEATHKESYGKLNARLDERIAGLKKAEKKAKTDTKAKKAEQTTQAEKPAKTDEKQGKEAKKSTVATTTAVAVIPAKSEAVTAQPQATPKEVTAEVATKPATIKDTAKKEAPKATTAKSAKTTGKATETVAVAVA